MDIAEPTLVPGATLKQRRKAYGVSAVALARKLRHDRGTIAEWEDHPGLDVRRQRLYMAALRQCIEEME